MSDFRETFEMEFDVYLLTPTMVRFGLVIHTSLKGSITCSITFSIFIFFCSNFKAKFGALFLCYFFKRLKLLYRNLFLNTTTIDRSWILDHFKWYSVFTFWVVYNQFVAIPNFYCTIVVWQVKYNHKKCYTGHRKWSLDFCRRNWLRYPRVCSVWVCEYGCYLPNSLMVFPNWELNYPKVQQLLHKEDNVQQSMGLSRKLEKRG